MLFTGFEHEDATVFFYHVGWDFFQAFRANRSRCFDETIKSKVRPRELDVRRSDVYELAWIVQFISRVISTENVICFRIIVCELVSDVVVVA